MKIFEWIKELFDFFIDKSKTLSQKAFLAIAIIFVLFCIDNLTGFLFYYNNDKKIVQVNKINEILHDTSLTKQERQSVIEMRLNTINHENIKDKVYTFFTKIHLKNTDNGINKKFYGFWYFLSISFVWLILIVSLPISSFIGRADIPIKAVFAFEILFICICYAQYQLFTLIPIINGNPIYNYLVNIAFNIVGTLIAAYYIDKHNKG